MEAIPEVRDVAVELAALADETLDPVQTLNAVASLASALMPSCVGVSITVLVDGEPFTVTATSEEVAVLDASQYHGGGPCVDAAANGSRVLVEDVLDERQWHWYAQAAATHSIRAGMSLPLMGAGGRVPGALNLYADDPHAFRGKEQQIADLFGAHVDDLVANAELSFMTRDFARELPKRLADHEQVDEAVETLVQLHGWTRETARERLDVAATHARTSPASVARIVMVLDT